MNPILGELIKPTMAPAKRLFTRLLSVPGGRFLRDAIVLDISRKSPTAHRVLPLGLYGSHCGVGVEVIKACQRVGWWAFRGF